MQTKTISARIPESLYVKIQQSDKGNTEAVIAGLELLFSNTQQEQESNTDSDTELIQLLKEQLSIKDQQIHILQMSHQALLTKVESKPMMIEAPGAAVKRWWEFWK